MQVRRTALPQPAFTRMLRQREAAFGLSAAPPEIQASQNDVISDSSGFFLITMNLL